MTRRLCVLTLAGAAVLASTGCGPDRGPQSWIGERTAAVRCTSSGPTRMPPVLFGVPAPVAPTGLYARVVDPMALDELGYERDRVACAILEAPSQEELEQTRAALKKFAATRAAASEAAVSAAGRCTCEVARELKIVELVTRCEGAAVRSTCDTQRNQDAVTKAMAPVVQALPDLPLPLRHWRLVGPSDRDGWFADKHMELLERHDGGSTVFLTGKPIPSYENVEFISRLLDITDVVAVVQQDAGRGWLIVRESRGDLILDHFQYPDDIPLALVQTLNSANPDVFATRLAKPGGTRELMLDVGKGNIVEFDAALVERVDELMIAGTFLTSKPYAVEAEVRSAPTAFVERVAYQAPFGKNGEQLVVRLELTDAGQGWAQGVGDDRLSPTLDDIGLGAEAATYTAPPGSKTSMLGRGMPTEFSGVHGLRRVPDVMAAVERAYPGTIGGTGTNWELTMPKSDLASVVGPDATFEGLRQMFAEKDYVVTAGFEKDREAVTVQAKPR